MKHGHVTANLSRLALITNQKNPLISEREKSKEKRDDDDDDGDGDRGAADKLQPATFFPCRNLTHLP